MLATLRGDNIDDLSRNRTKFGSLLESFVVTEILKVLSVYQKPVSLYHFAQHQGKEVDLVLENARREIVGIEIKASSSVHAKSLNGLRALQSVYQDRFVCGVVLCDRLDVKVVGDQLYLLPISSLWH